MKSNRLLKTLKHFLLLRKRLKISFSSVSIWMDDWTGALNYCNTFNSVDRRNLGIERSIKASVKSSFNVFVTLPIWNTPPSDFDPSFSSRFLIQCSPAEIGQLLLNRFLSAVCSPVACQQLFCDAQAEKPRLQRQNSKQDRMLKLKLPSWLSLTCNLLVFYL